VAIQTFNSDRYSVGKTEYSIFCGFVHGAATAYGSAATVTIGTTAKPSAAMGSSANFIIDWSGVLTADITTSGAGGLQTGETEAADTWYGIHVIGDSTGALTPAALLIPEGVAFSEAGYDTERRVGWVRNDAASDFVPFRSTGTSKTRRIIYTNSVADRAVLAGGADVGFVAVPCAVLVPPSVFTADVQVRETGTVSCLLAITGAGDLQAGVLPGNEVKVTTYPLDSSRQLAYGHLAGGGVTDIWISGYREDI